MRISIYNINSKYNVIVFEVTRADRFRFAALRGLLDAKSFHLLLSYFSGRTSYTRISSTLYTYLHYMWVNIYMQRRMYSAFVLKELEQNRQTLLAASSNSTNMAFSLTVN